MKKSPLFLLLTLTIFASCGHTTHSHEEPGSNENTESVAQPDHQDAADEIAIPAHIAKEAHIAASTITPGDFHGVLKTSGKVLSATGDESTVVATVTGVVSLNRKFTDGTSVAKGTPLFTISTSKLADGDVSSRASIAYNTAKAEFERAEKLIADKIITEKEYLAAKADLENARLAYEALGAKTAKGISISSPASGFVVGCNVKDGDYVEVGQPLMTITQNRNLYLRAEVPERDYHALHQITSAKFKPSYSDRVYDLSQLNGRLVSYGKSASATSSFIPVTFEFSNTSGIVPGSFAEIFLIKGKRENVISIPVAALIEEQGVYSVFIKEDDVHYRKQEVTTGDSDGDFIEIIAGVKPGDNVVTEGAIRVKLASASSAIPAHNHNH